MKYLTIAVPVIEKYDADACEEVPVDPQPDVKKATAPMLVEADSPQDAARKLAQEQNPGFPAEYVVIDGDTVTVTLTAA